MGARPSTPQQPIRPRSDTFPHVGSTSGSTLHHHQSNGSSSTTNGNLFQASSSSTSRAGHGSTRGAPGSGSLSLGPSANGSRRLRSMSAVETPSSHPRTVVSGSDSDDSSPDVEDPYPAIFRLHGSLPLRFFQLAGIKCPVCSKQIASDNVEYHLVECLTKTRVVYNEEVLVEPKGECVICFEDMEPGHTIARLPCLCVYHKRCIDSWFKVNRSCPEHPGD